MPPERPVTPSRPVSIAATPRKTRKNSASASISPPSSSTPTTIQPQQGIAPSDVAESYRPAPLFTRDRVISTPFRASGLGLRLALSPGVAAAAHEERAGAGLEDPLL